MKKKILTLLFAAVAAASFAGQTATFLKQRASASADVKPGQWHASRTKAIAYAKSHGVPLVAVWSNGDNCGHCIGFESACCSTEFKNWLKTSGIVFQFSYPKDSTGAVGGADYNWCLGNQRLFPLIRIYWYTKDGKKKLDEYQMGDTITGGFQGSAGGKNAVAWFKKKFKNYTPPAEDDDSGDGGEDEEPVVIPYTIAFDGNGATNSMDGVETQVGASVTLPANSFVRPDYAFAGWAKTASGSVVYKNAATVKNLAATSNATVTLYAKWTRTTYRTYYTGVKSTITISDCKGWTKKSGSISGMTWNASKGKWTGTPKKAGTFTTKYKKGSTTRTRYIVVVKDAVVLADASAAAVTAEAGSDALDIDLAPSTKAGTPKSVKVTGLPTGLKYDASTGRITGTIAKAGIYTVTVTVVSAKGQKLTKTLTFTAPVPDACFGTFNGLTGWNDGDETDPDGISNRGLFKLVAPRTANLSAKIITAKATYALTGKGWTPGDDGTYTAELATSNGKNKLTVTIDSGSASGEEPEVDVVVDEESGESAEAESSDTGDCDTDCAPVDTGDGEDEGGEEADAVSSNGLVNIGEFVATSGIYSVFAQKSRFVRDASGAYTDETVAAVAPKIVGKWYFKPYGKTGAWTLGYATSKTAKLTLTVSADGTAKLAGTLGSYKVSSTSAVLVLDGDVEKGFVRAAFPVPVSVKSGSKTVKKTLSIETNLWFDKSDSHRTTEGESVGRATVETFE